MLIQSVTVLRDGLSYTSSENKTPGKAKTTPFFPVIVGYMQTRGNGTVVDVKMRLFSLSCAWTSGWFSLGNRE